MTNMPRGRTRIVLASLAVMALVVSGVVAVPLIRRSRVDVAPPRYASMAESGRAMQQAGAAMQAHGLAMRDAGQRVGDQLLVAHGDHWLRDGQSLVQGGTWMAMDPTAAENLATAPGDLAASGDWTRLRRYNAAMQHDPNRIQGGVDQDALRANGLSMQADGQAMAEHGRVMAEEMDTLVARHGLDDQAVAELRQATQTLRDVGDALTQNGVAMVGYVDRLRRGMGFR